MRLFGVVSIILLLSFTILKAQNIIFTDPNLKYILINNNCALFKNETVFKVADLNGDGEISLDEAEQIVELKLKHGSIISLNGIEKFINLELLNCSNNQINDFKINELTNLKSLDCSNNQIVTIDLLMYKELEELNCSNNLLHYLNTKDLNNLITLSANNNQISNLILPQNNTLESINIANNKINYFDFSNEMNLEMIEVSNNNIDSLDLSKNPKLKTLNCATNYLETLDLKFNSKLVSLQCENNKLKLLNLASHKDLASLDCSINKICDINLFNISNLEVLACYGNKIKFLDLSSCQGLSVLVCFSNDSLEYINIKNVPKVKLEFADPIFGSNLTKLKLICCNQERVGEIKDYMFSLGIDCIVSAECNFIPNGSYSKLNGTILFDYSLNGCDSSDFCLSTMKFSIIGANFNGQFISKLSNQYSIYLKPGNYTITPQIENLDYFTIIPENLKINVLDTGIINGLDFCIQPKVDSNDLEINVLHSQIRPGFESNFQINYTNKGNKVEDGDISFAFAGNKLSFISSSQSEDKIENGLIIWKFKDLLPFESRKINVVLLCNSPSQQPSVNVGDLLSFNANIYINNEDVNISNNYFGFRPIVVGSFDPNDKICIEGDEISYEKIGEYLHYLIRFENTGNFEAVNVVIKDMVDTTKFDISTLETIDASHEYFARIIDGNQVLFIFENINLPFTGIGKYGYIAFKIKTKSSLVKGQYVTNLASIFFDYNLPIVTNVAKSEFIQTTSISAPESVIYEMYPNPVSDYLYINVSNVELNLEIYDCIGELYQSNTVVDGRIDVKSLIPGIYLARFKNSSGFDVKKFVKR